MPTTLNSRSKLVALLDLDGTLANYDSAMDRDIKKIFPDKYQDDDWRAHQEEPHLKNLIRMIRSQPGWWRNLEPLEDGLLLLDLLRKYNFCLNILTKGPFNHSNSWSEKVDWSRKYVPDASITITEDKSLVYGKLLVDDWPPYVMGWLEYRPRGLVILPDRPWNKGLEHPQIVRYNNNLSEIEDAIQALVNRSLKKNDSTQDD